MRKLFTPSKLMLCIVTLLFIAAGCNYYKKKTGADNPLPAQNGSGTASDYVIVHFGNDAWHLTNIVYDKTKASVTGDLSAPDAHRMAMYSMLTKKKAVKIESLAEQAQLQQQVHVFVSNIRTEGDSNMRCEIADTSFARMEYFDIANGRIALITTGIVGGSVLVGVGVIFLICGCPMVYTMSDTAMEYNGGLFPGSLSYNMSRYDVLPIGDYRNKENTLAINIFGKKDEHQYLDEVTLLSVQHAKGSTVMFDRDMNAYAVTGTQAPLSVHSENGIDHRAEVLAKDDSPYTFSEPTGENHFNDLHLTFAYDGKTDRANLVLNAGNTGWSSYLYDEFVKLYGNKYPSFAKLSAKQEPEEKTERLKNQGMLMSVYMKKNGEWEFVDYLPIAGTIYRNTIIPLDLSGIAAGENVEIKLRSGYRLWNVDQVALDYTTNAPLAVSTVKATSAINASGENVLPKLLSVDNNYVENTSEKDVTSFKFQLEPVNENEITSLFVKGYGYYTQERSSKEKPDMQAIRQISKDGGFSAFSETRFGELKRFGGLFVVKE